MSNKPHYWAVVPAAGIGSRMQAQVPKQYLPLAGSTVLEHTLQRLLNHPMIAGLVVALAADDSWWSTLAIANDPRVRVVDGGAERSDSVRHALDLLLREASPSDCVLVHDAARPCIRGSDISRLIEQVGDNDNGGLLGLPAKDTIKQSLPSHGPDQQPDQRQDQRVDKTLDRSRLWQAFTPQLFPLQLLHQALHHAAEQQIPITDDASAMELLGYQPLLVEGNQDNIKITRPDDLALAEFYLQQQT